MKWTIAALIAIVLGSTEGVASAQTLGGGAYVGFGSTRFAATDTFEAIAGTSSKSGVGFGGFVTGFWQGLFVDAGYSQLKLAGERVFIDQGTVYPLGIPVRITLRPLDLAGGWRFHVNRISPYAGAGVVVLSYAEESDFSSEGDDVDERKTGLLLLAGADVHLLRFVSVGGELRYRAISAVLGSGGVSQVFGDDQLGGVALAARVVVGR
jgi:opacity protein-like surface antigen